MLVASELNRTLEERVEAQVNELDRMGRLRRFLPRQLAEMVISSGDESMLESHRREVSVVFCDLRGFTAFSEVAEPEEIMRTVKEIWIYKKNSQPLNTKNSGCIFKNPRGVSAGALIDRAGLKGLQIGGASVSEKHANFIIAGKGCKSRDVMRLIEAVKERVKEQFGVELELEIEIW